MLRSVSNVSGITLPVVFSRHVRKLKHCREARFSIRTYSSGFQKDRLDKGADPGSWNFSPEWMGTQNGGWGDNEGELTFSEQSDWGNGLVNVTRHYLSKQDNIPLFHTAVDPEDASHIRTGFQDLLSKSDSLHEEWRVLRFNDRTVQSVARTIVAEKDGSVLDVIQRADCMAFLYMQSIAAVVASSVGLAPEGSSLKAALQPNPSQQCRALCIGLGGGSLPLFLAHHFPGMQVDVVELDEVVIEAATTSMGFPQSRPRLKVHHGDAVQWLQDHCAQGHPPFDFVFVDAFDGNNAVPSVFTKQGEPFLEDLAGGLHPEHGVAIVNLHRGDLPPLWKQVIFKLQGTPWIDPSIAPIAEAYKHHITPGGSGVTYTLQVGPQYNVIVVAARGKHLTNGMDLSRRLKQAASDVALACKYRFNAADKSVLDFREQ